MQFGERLILVSNNFIAHLSELKTNGHFISTDILSFYLVCHLFVIPTLLTGYNLTSYVLEAAASIILCKCLHGFFVKIMFLLVLFSCFCFCFFFTLKKSLLERVRLA